MIPSPEDPDNIPKISKFPIWLQNFVIKLLRLTQQADMNILYSCIMIKFKLVERFKH